MPVFRGKYSYAIVFLNRRTDGTPSEVISLYTLSEFDQTKLVFSSGRQVSVTLNELGLDHVDGYHITDLYDDYDYGIVTPERRFKVDVNPSGSKYPEPCISLPHTPTNSWFRRCRDDQSQHQQGRLVLQQLY